MTHNFKTLLVLMAYDRSSCSSIIQSRVEQSTIQEVLGTLVALWWASRHKKILKQKKIAWTHSLPFTWWIIHELHQTCDRRSSCKIQCCDIPIYCTVVLAMRNFLPVLPKSRMKTVMTLLLMSFMSCLHLLKWVAPQYRPKRAKQHYRHVLDGSLC